MLRLAAVITIASAGTIDPAGAASPVQRCTRPEPEAQAGTAVFRPGLNARATQQKITADAELSRCVPEAQTGGAGTLSAKFKPPAAQTCALINRAHTLTGTATITWKNGKTSALPHLTFALSGASRVATVKGKIESGRFAGRSVAGQFRYAPFASHHGTTVAQACANKVAANQKNRNSVVQMKLFRTAPFTVS
jgi:hypothetical protein